MRVAMYYNNSDVRLEELPKPKIGPGEILVKAMACGICGSDVMEWYRIKKAPRVLGHEMTGEIVEVGAGVKYRAGDRAFISHHVPCNTCRYCLTGHHTACETLHTTNFDPGGFAEFVRVPSLQVDRGIYLLPDDMSCEAGTFIEPLACCLRGQRNAGVKPGDSIFVIGSGISGLLHIQLARLLGASSVFASDVSQFRLDAAKRFRASAVIDAKKEKDVPGLLKELNGGRLVDKVIVCTGAPAAPLTALQSVDRGGIILFFAVPEPTVNVPVNFNDMWRNEVTLTTSYGAGPSDLSTSLELLRGSGLNVHDMITHRLGLAEAGLGFKLVAKAEDSIKVIVEPYR